MSYVTIDGLNFSGDTAGQLIQFTGNGTDVTVKNSNFSNPSGSCIDFTQSDVISLTNNSFTNCNS